MEILRANESHIRELVAQWQDFMDYHQKLDPLFQRRPDGHVNFGKFLRELLRDEEAAVFVAVEGQQVAGRCLCKVDRHPPVFVIERYGHLIEMYVTPRFQRQGIGSLLLRAAQDFFAARGIDRIELGALPQNAIGFAFWKKQGFETYMHRMALTRPR